MLCVPSSSTRTLCRCRWIKHVHTNVAAYFFRASTSCVLCDGGVGSLTCCFVCDVFCPVWIGACCSRWQVSLLPSLFALAFSSPSAPMCRGEPVDSIKPPEIRCSLARSKRNRNYQSPTATTHDGRRLRDRNGPPVPSPRHRRGRGPSIAQCTQFCLVWLGSGPAETQAARCHCLLPFAFVLRLRQLRCAEPNPLLRASLPTEAGGLAILLVVLEHKSTDLQPKARFPTTTTTTTLDFKQWLLLLRIRLGGCCFLLRLSFRCCLCCFRPRQRLGRWSWS